VTENHGVTSSILVLPTTKIGRFSRSTPRFRRKSVMAAVARP
jgi:hypothetical protein